MQLEISVLSYKGKVPEWPLKAVFGESGGDIGRGVGCLMVLEDPSKNISRRHAHIDCREGRFYFADTSGAGTEFRERGLLLTQDQIELKDGERFRICDYELEARIVDTTQERFTDGFDFLGHSSGISAMPPSLPESTDSGLWSQVFDRRPVSPTWPSDTNERGEPDSDWPGSTAAGFPPTPSRPVFLDRQDAPAVQGSFVPPDIAQAPIAPPVDPDDWNLGELLAGLEDEGPAVGRTLGAGHDGPDALLAGLEDPEWEADVVEIRNPLPLGEGRVREKLDVSTALSEPSAPLALTPTPLPEGEGLTSTTPGRDSLYSSGGQFPPEVAHGRAPKASAVEAASLGEGDSQRMAQGENAPRRDALVAAFCEGAGLTVDVIDDPREYEAAMRSAGALFRELVDGMMTVLRARAELKSQFRVSMTTMKAANNNPLKFTASVDDALKLLLRAGHPGFMEPRQAVKDGMVDVMNHQLAMTAGIQASIASALRRFDPESFEKNFSEGLVMNKKARLWEAYVAAYPDIVALITENIFGDEFAEVYERQMHLLRSSGHGSGSGGIR